LAREIIDQNENVKKLSYELKSGLKTIFGHKLKKIIIYGSYARGEFEEGSDIDIMVLLDMVEDEIEKKKDEVIDLTVELTTRFGIVISIIENNHDYFNDWMEVLPFFANVAKEGVSIYGR